MSRFMNMLNNISRSQAIYRRSKISEKTLQSSYYSYAYAICREPGRSQEELAKDLCVNKSTIARNLNFLEEKGYVERKSMPLDKRRFSVYPTDKLLAVLPEIQAVSKEWRTLLAEGIPPNEFEIFESVLLRMEVKAREIIERQEANK